MKKVHCLLLVCMTIAIGQSNAQSTSRDNTMNNKKSMQRDSGRINKMYQQGDSMMRSGKKSIDDWNTSMSDWNSNMSGQDTNRRYRNNEMNAPDVSNWPEAGRMAVDEITKKYGPADYFNEDELNWMNKGVWKKICISKMESKHSFPIEHTDNMTTTISYKVPVDKMDDLGRFDGSVTFDRTQGLLSARCDKEANNFLALNLANDIVKGKKTVEQARKAFADIVKSKMNGANPIYMQKLTFASSSKAADPDINTTGLTKDDVSKGIKKNKK